MDLNNLGRILVPFDFADLSFRALRTALSIAPPERIDLLHVMSVAGGLAWAAGLAMEDDQVRVEGVRMRVDRELTAHGLDPVGLQLHVRTGSPGPEIVEFASTLNPDLIIMGSHGRTGTIERLLMGSVAYSVVRGAAAPVLVIR
jgi:nucleotide-binding universal stress UspA family protein